MRTKKDSIKGNSMKYSQEAVDTPIGSVKDIAIYQARLDGCTLIFSYKAMLQDGTMRQFYLPSLLKEAKIEFDEIEFLDDFGTFPQKALDLIQAASEKLSLEEWIEKHGQEPSETSLIKANGGKL